MFYQTAIITTKYTQNRTKTTSSLRVHILKWSVLIHKYDTVISPDNKATQCLQNNTQFTSNSVYI